MRTSTAYNGGSPASLPVVDATKPGGGCNSDLITDANPHYGQWFAITALSTTVLGFQSDTVQTLNGVDPSLVAPSALVVGQTYTIYVAGNTNWVALGASANQAGVTFVATGTGAGSGTANPAGVPNQFSGIPLPAGCTIYGDFSEVTLASGAVIAYRG